MLLELYIDKGILFSQLLRLSDIGYEVRICRSFIEVGDSGRKGAADCPLTLDSVEDAIRDCLKHEPH